MLLFDWRNWKDLGNEQKGDRFGVQLRIFQCFNNIFLTFLKEKFDYLWRNYIANLIWQVIWDKIKRAFEFSLRNRVIWWFLRII